MSKRPHDDAGPITSWGIPGGSTLFENSRRGLGWSVWASVIVGLIGLTGTGLGIAYAAWGLAIASALLFVVGAAWTGSAVRSHRSALRLERRARRTPGESS
ncbi:hypothetical protein [Micromonospora sp. NPDC093277]|uniref:hypothetical protein n=1 Tax=Micromonospora sp. NPDC093277 TaxID=3364291 RepID=UPI0038050A24